MMFTTIVVILVTALTAYSAEISSPYATFEKQPFQPDLKTEPVDRTTYKRDAAEPERHPIYNPEERRVKVEPVKPIGEVVKHDRMLADQPAYVPTDINQNVNQAISGYEYVPGLDEVAFPNVPYAPGYPYDNAHLASNRYDDMPGNNPSPYYVTPDISPFSLLWSQVPDARTIVSYVGGLVSWTLGSIFLLFLGTLLTVGVCSYTNVCTITYNGIGPIHEEMRSYMTPDNLDKISNAATLVKTAIDKYNGDQNVANVAVKRRRRAIFY